MVPAENEEFTWYVDEEAFTSVSPEEPPPRRSRHPRRHLVFSGLVVLVLLAGALYVHMRWRETQIRRDFQAVVDREWQLYVASPSGPHVMEGEEGQSLAFFGPQLMFALLYPPTLSLPPRVVEVTLRDNGTTAWVIEEAESSRERCRWVVFYHNTDAGWQRTAPDPRFWGDAVEGKTEHFHWQTYECEADIAQEHAQWLENVYVFLASYLPPENIPKHIEVKYEITYTDLPVQEGTFMTAGVFYLWGITPERKPCAVVRLLHLYQLVDGLVTGEKQRIRLGPPSSTHALLVTGIKAFLVERSISTVASDLKPVWKRIGGVAGVTIAEGGPPPNVEDLRWNMRGSGYYTRLLVAYIGDTYGQEGIRKLIRALRGDAIGMRAILREALGPDLDMEMFNRQWHAYIQEHASAPSHPVTPVPSGGGN